MFDPEIMFGVTFGRRSNLNTFCPFCEDAETSSTPSCSVSRKGLFNCKVCGVSGGGVKFYSQVHGISESEAIARIKSQQKPDVEETQEEQTFKISLDDDLVSEMHDDLMSFGGSMLGYLINKRGLNRETLERYRIGRDEWRITIPIFVDGNVVNVRRYLPNAPKATPKMVSHAAGNGTPVLFPVNNLSMLPAGSQLILCEGEWDCLLLNQMGFAAITTTGSVRTWSDTWTDWILGYDVVIIYDVNDDGPPKNLGQVCARQRARQILRAGGSARIVELPIQDRGGDVTDYVVKYGHTAEDLRNLIDSAPRIRLEDLDDEEDADPADVDPDDIEVAEDEDISEVDLFVASDGQYVGQRLLWKGVVAGRGSSPYIYPKKFSWTRTSADNLTESGVEFIHPWDTDILGFVGRTESQQQAAMRKRINASRTDKVSMQILDSGTLEEVFLIPPLDRDSKTEHCLRRCFYHGHGLSTNRTYQFMGFTVPMPDSQQATQVIVSAEPAFTEVDDVILMPAKIEQMRQIFSAEDVHEKLEEIASELSITSTKIKGRPDLHVAVDLVMHSPLEFFFDGMLIRRGYMEALIIGDTRTGKGFVAEGLCRHYGMGEVVSAENLTLAGLIGGVQRVGDKWTLTWGRLPLNDRRLVVVDECSALAVSDFGKLSRIRSEGVAEVTKVITESTHARVRMIYISNPRNARRTIDDYNHGVEAVPELIGSPEDVARFDFALVVSRGDVSSEIINSAADELDRRPKYTQEACKDLVVWCWSRNREHVRFSNEAVDSTYKAAKLLGKEFSPKIALIQQEDVRLKIARIAAASAGRTFSTSDGVHLDIGKKHVEFALDFLRHIYNKPVAGYGRLSEMERAQTQIGDPKAIFSFLHSIVGGHLKYLLRGLLQHSLLSRQDIIDFAGVEEFEARNILSFLIRENCLEKASGSQYRKRAGFRKLLNEWIDRHRPEEPEEGSSDE